MPAYVTQIDVRPVAWQFLQNLRMDDLPSELVQNELDAGSLETRLTFGKDEFTCQGTGEAIDADGWKRLSYFMGAGNEAPRKQSKTGVKNHGLKTCFTVGDHIRLRSDGKLFEQTLYRDGETESPCPGTYATPINDESAPKVGCRIEVPYRRTRLVTKDGEPFEFAPVDEHELEDLFSRLVNDAPRRFLGVIRPGFRDKYTLVVTHWRLGTVTFHFTSRRISQKPKEHLFARMCKATTSDSIEVESRYERALVFPFRLSPQELGEVPEFYAWRRGACGEVSWTVDDRGQPISDIGLCRYPLTYPDDIKAGRTRLGVFYSAPFKSDSFRHGLGNQSSDLNARLIEECDQHLVTVLRSHLMPRYGPGALSIVCDTQEPDSQRALQLVGKIVAAGAIPIVSDQGLRRRRRVSKRIAAYNGIRSTAPKKYTFVIPAEGNQLSGLLALANTTGFPMVDPSTPATVVSLLLSEDCKGWGESYVSFDWKDIVNRLLRCENNWFSVPTEAELAAELFNEDIAPVYLDVLDSLETGPRSETWGKCRVELLSRLCLPDTNGDLQPLSLLYRAPHVPLVLPGIKVPAIVHPVLAKHPLLARHPWRREKLDFLSYLNDLNLEQDPEHRVPFWHWLRSQSEAIPSKMWSRLKQLPIWPDKLGRQVKFVGLCRPSDTYLVRAMAGILSAPHSQTEKLSSEIPKIGKIRSTPTFAEMEAWYSTSVRALPKVTLSESDLVRFRQIEATLLRLSQKQATRKHVKRLGASILVLARDGSLRHPAALHALTPAIRRLCLLPMDVAECRDERLAPLFPLSSELQAPALVRAMKDDAQNVAAFEYRVLAYSDFKREGRRDLENLEAAPIVPFGDTVVPPSSLAFSGKEDYWGIWKRKLNSKQLSARLQTAYRDIGVVSATPITVRSREFFAWLARQPSEVLERHLSCVLRHFHIDSGVQSWWASFPDPCIPVYQGGVPKLIGLSESKLIKQPAFIPDFPELARQVVANRASHLRVLVVSHPDVRRPLDDLFRRHGFVSLRKAAGDPSVATLGEVGDITSDFSKIFDVLHSHSFRKNLHKSLSALDLDHKLLRDNWLERIQAASRVMIAQELHLTYLIAGELYRVSVEVAFDASTRSIWLTSQEGAETQLFHAIGECLFVAGAPRYTRSVVSEIFFSAGRDPFHLESEGPMESDEMGEDGNSELGETFETHKKLPLPNVPRPVPMSRTLLEHRVNGARPAPMRSTARPSVEIERIHRQELKESQYAWHCQICLGELDPSQLAPLSSYSEHAINRQGMIAAHHADQVHPGGARHGGNLVLLCRRHHEFVGDSLTREVITHALRDSFTRKELEFAVNDTESTVVAGLTIAVTLPDHELPVSFFFTQEHRELWLSFLSDHAAVWAAGAADI